MSKYLKPITCPNCGAGFKIDKNSVYAECPYCGSEFKIEDPVMDQIRLNESEMDQTIRFMKESEREFREMVRQNDISANIIAGVIIVVIILVVLFG